MSIVIKGIGIVITLMGVAYSLKPQLIRRLMGFFKIGRRIYLPGLLRLALAILFVRWGRECSHPWVVFASGMIFMAGGLLIFALGPARIRWVFDWYDDQPIHVFRVIAVTVLIFGAIVTFSA